MHAYGTHQPGDGAVGQLRDVEGERRRLRAEAGEEVGRVVERGGGEGGALGAGLGGGHLGRDGVGGCQGCGWMGVGHKSAGSSSVGWARLHVA